MNTKKWTEKIKMIRTLLDRSDSLCQCMHCGGFWPTHQFHTTVYRQEAGRTLGCFPLSEACWEKLTPQERLPYYEKLVDRWEADHLLRRPAGSDDRGDYERIRQEVRQAVLDGN